MARDGGGLFGGISRDLTALHYTVLGLGAFVSYLLGLAVWRLYLSPLAKIPGPKLAALTGWYETYLELVKDGGGRLLFEYKGWHDKYGTRCVNTYLSCKRS